MASSDTEAGPSSLAQRAAELSLTEEHQPSGSLVSASPPAGQSNGSASNTPPPVPSQAQTPDLARRPTGGPPSRVGAGGGGPPGSGGGGPQPRQGAGLGSLANVNSRAKAMAGGPLPPSLMAKLQANASRSAAGASGAQPSDPQSLLSRGAGAPGGPGLGSLRAAPTGPPRAPAPPSGPTGGGPALGGMAARRARPAFKLSDMGVTAEGGPNGTGGPGTSQTGAPAGRAPGQKLAPPGRLASANGPMSSAFANFSNVVDPSGRLNFDGKAILHKSGVEFRNGTKFQINMEDLELLDELGRGNYGTVRKVRHTRTKVEMAMKEIRLELDESKLNAIIMELDILHRATAPEIVEFYGAFFVESCVYYCMEYMDAKSLESLYHGSCSVPEDVLARIVAWTVRGLRFLKDELQIMHRDVKPTNILLNRKGEVKLCDFGVSGQLEKSLAKTNIGCQSYMAPERIKGESQNLLGTYTVASDVWSLGLTIVETTLGTYPYPPETYSNVFAQLQAIVHGDPPQLPSTYSIVAQSFVASCLEKVPERRATYAQMLEHPWLVEDASKGKDGVDMEGWVNKALAEKAARKAEAAAGGPKPNA